MRKLILLPFALLLACTGSTKESPTDQYKVESTHEQTSVNSEPVTSLNWSGTINDTIPAFLHYSIHGDLIIGELSYLNGLNNEPLKVIGTIDQNKEYRVLQFEPDGNISAILTGRPDGKAFKGRLFLTSSNQEQQFNFSRKDTAVVESELMPEAGEIFGNYYYKYSEDGFQGEFQIKKVDDKHVAFDILSVTDERRGRNIADVPNDTIAMSGNAFTYTIPESDDCKFKATFYKGFVVVSYINGYCSGQFGLNATIDGIFLKVR